MGNKTKKQNKKQNKNSKANKDFYASVDKNAINLSNKKKKFRFFWQENSNATQGEQIWKAYSDEIQSYLEEEYQNFLQNSNKRYVVLPKPLNYYQIDFSELTQIEINDSQKKRQIKVENSSQRIG